MARRCLLVSMLLGFLVFSSARLAHAGGWWSFIDIGADFVSEGQRFQIDEDILFEDLGKVDPARDGTTRYFAYLVPNVDPGMLRRALSEPFRPGWWEPPEQATQVGTVSLDRWRSNLAWAHVEITIPNMSGGRYWLMLCDTGCRQPLADVVPDRVFVVEDPLTALLAEKTRRFSRLVRDQLGPLDKSLGLAWGRANSAHTRITELESRLVRIERSLAKHQNDRSRGLAWLPFAAGAGIVALGTWARRRFGPPRRVYRGPVLAEKG